MHIPSITLHHRFTGAHHPVPPSVQLRILNALAAGETAKKIAASIKAELPHSTPAQRQTLLRLQVAGPRISDCDAAWFLGLPVAIDAAGKARVTYENRNGPQPFDLVLSPKTATWTLSPHRQSKSKASQQAQGKQFPTLDELIDALVAA